MFHASTLSDDLKGLRDELLMLKAQRISGRHKLSDSLRCKPLRFHRTSDPSFEARAKGEMLELVKTVSAVLHNAESQVKQHPRAGLVACLIVGAAIVFYWRGDRPGRNHHADG